MTVKDAVLTKLADFKRANWDMIKKLGTSDTGSANTILEHLEKIQEIDRAMSKILNLYTELDD